MSETAKGPIGSRVRKAIFDAMPSRSALMHRWCSHYVNRFRGENNGDMHSNGEALVARELASAATVIFDAGANVGDWTAMVMEAAPVTAKFFCFEPCDETRSRLEARLGRVAHIVPVALSSESGKAELLISPSVMGRNSLHRRDKVVEDGALMRQTDKQKVVLKTLDSYCVEHGIDRIDLLKIDVEGHDLEVLRGGRELFRRGRVKAVQFEYSSCNVDSRTFLRDFFRFFQECGSADHAYSLHKVMPWGLGNATEYHVGLDNFQYQNWVALCQV